MKIRPLRDNVLLKRIDTEEKTKSGIIIPDTAKEKPVEAEIVAVGPGKRNDDGKRIEPEVKTGDRVLFGKWSGTEIELGGKKHLILHEDEILAVIKK
jgi:chaperonin GroES